MREDKVIALCVVLLIASVATLAAEGLYFSVSTGMVLPDDREVSTQTTTLAYETGFGWPGQIGVGYAVSGFRPEISFGYRRAPSSTFRYEKHDGKTSETYLKPRNDQLEKVEYGGYMSSLEVMGNIYYDINTATAFMPYIGVGAGLSSVSVGRSQRISSLTELERENTLWGFAFQAASGVGVALVEELTVFLGYRLTGTTEGEFSKSKERQQTALTHNIELGVRYRFVSP